MASKKLINALSKLRSEEVTASLQYMNHHAVFKKLNLGFIADILEKSAIEEMKHAEKITDRMLDMDLDPKGYNIADAPHWSMESVEMLKVDRDLEISAIKLYNDAIALCVEEKDHINRQLLDEILLDEEGHRLKFDNLLEAMEKIGDLKGGLVGMIQALGDLKG
jgi:bacterioferritin